MFHPNAGSLDSMDPEINSLVASELKRQEEGLELIASENYASPAVMAAQGTVLTNKYAEGQPRKRYYGGCEFVDGVEELAQVQQHAIHVSGGSPVESVDRSRQS